MKSKLIKELLAVLMNVKEEQNDVSLDITDDNKESVYSELLIPLMNLTTADTAEMLKEKLDFLVNGDVDSEEYLEFAGMLVNYILDDEESDTNFSDELQSLIVNCVATLNTLNEIAGSDEETEENKEAGLVTLNEELVALMNTDEEDATDEEAEETDESVEEKDESNEATGEETDEEEASDEETDESEETDEDENADPLAASKDEAGEDMEGEGEADDAEAEAEPKGEGMVYEIVAAADQVDETPWGEVNKVELKNMLMAAVEANDENKAAVDETFALVKSYDKVADQQWPHHVAKDGKIVLNVNGLKAAALFLLKPNASKNLTTDERTSIAKHLLRHYEAIDMDQPDKLNKLAEGKESTIVINVKDDELQEFGEMFQVNAEDIGTYVGLMEALLTDFVNSGIIDIESDSDEFDESVIAVKLDKKQTEEFIKYFDIMSDDIVSILAGNLDELSYRQTDNDLENRNNESNARIGVLEQQIEDLNTTIDTQKTELQELANSTVDQHLTQTKFQAIVDFVKSSEDVDDTIIQFINNVIEAESGRDIQYMAKIGRSFMKASANSDLNRFVKKGGILKKVATTDVEDLLDLVDDNKESTNNSSVNDRVDHLSSYLD